MYKYMVWLVVQQMADKSIHRFSFLLTIPICVDMKTLKHMNTTTLQIGTLGDSIIDHGQNQSFTQLNLA